MITLKIRSISRPILLSTMAGLCAISLFIGCGSSGSAETTARSFLEAFYNYDLDEAAKFADQNGQQQIAAAKASLADDATDHEPVEVEILEITEEGDTATCLFVLKNSKNDANALPEQLFLQKIDNQWVVKW